MVATIATGSAALAADSFRFHGSGYGHGIGMSQWGAYGMAKDGWGYRRILTHFYSGTRVVDATLPSKVRVGLTRGRSTIQLTARSGPVELWLDRPGATFVARIPGGQTWTVSGGRPPLRKYAIRDGAGALVTGARVGGPARPLFVTYRDGARVFVPEADEVWHEGFATHTGSWSSTSTPVPAVASSD